MEEQPKLERLCLICGKPMKRKTDLCDKCRKRKRELVDMYSKLSINVSLSNRNLLVIQKRHPEQSVFDYLIINPRAIYEAYSVSKEERGRLRRQEKKRGMGISKIYINIEKANKNGIPKYLIDLQGKLPALKFHTVEGDSHNPVIFFTCKRCGKDYKCRMKDILEKSHSCPASISSGEAVIKEFLAKNGISYRTQRDTLICINPDTGYQLPYDFELPNLKIIIEVQGEQHFHYVSKFHQTEEGFEYQQKKDAYKKDYAVSRGYKYVEINYGEIADGSYVEILRKAIACVSKVKNMSGRW